MRFASVLEANELVAVNTFSQARRADKLPVWALPQNHRLDWDSAKPFPTSGEMLHADATDEDIATSSPGKIMGSRTDVCTLILEMQGYEASPGNLDGRLEPASMNALL